VARPRPTYLPIGTFIHLAVWPQQTWDENRVGGGLYPFRYGELHGSPSNTLWPGPRPISLPSGILIHPTVSPQQARAENWGLCLFGERELCLHLTQCGVGRGYVPTKLHLASSRMATRHGRKFGGWRLFPLVEGSWVPI